MHAEVYLGKWPEKQEGGTEKRKQRKVTEVQRY